MTDVHYVTPVSFPFFIRHFAWPNKITCCIASVNAHTHTYTPYNQQVVWIYWTHKTYTCMLMWMCICVWTYTQPNHTAFVCLSKWNVNRLKCTWFAWVFFWANIKHGKWYDVYNSVWHVRAHIDILLCISNERILDFSAFHWALSRWSTKAFIVYWIFNEKPYELGLEMDWK